MKTLVIHPKDPTTDFLRDIYKNIPNSEVTIISDNSFEKQLKHLEFDRAIILGHGTPFGLIGINIKPLLLKLRTQKDNVYIWCNADQFVRDEGLGGMCTGMMISEVNEARMYGIFVNQFEISASNKLFAEVIGKHLEDLDTEQIVLHTRKEYEGASKVVQFNNERIYHFK